MKKWILAMLAVCLTLFCATAIAASSLTVSFTEKRGSINGGFDYALSIKINRTQDEDLPVDVLNETTGEVLTIVIPAGETSASTMIATEKTEKPVKVDYALQKTDKYSVGAKHTLTIQPLPKVQFYLAVSFGQVGKEMSVVVTCSNPASVIRGNNVFQLRDTAGTVLAEKAWANGKNRLTFKFPVDENLLGKHKMNVWLGDCKVSTADGYGTVVDASKRALSEVETDLPLMAIGFDCGFNGRKTDQILEVLEKHNVKCTFFMTGYFLREFPDEAKRIYEAGHEIANHSNTHKQLRQLKPYDLLRQMLVPTEEAEALLGVTPRLFRPPYGEYNANVSSIARAEGMEMIMWSATFHDSTGKYTEAQIYRCATTGNDYKPGTIALCHLDGYYQPNTLDAGLTHYEELGLTVVPISALLCASGHELPPMPEGQEALVYTNEYWENWVPDHYPEMLNTAE